MARERTLTDLGMAILGLAAERPMHPYEMYQLLLQRHDDTLVKVRPGTLYHAVSRLAAAGLVTALGTQKDSNRPERTTYAISAEGKVALAARLKDLLSTPVNEFPKFPQAIAEAHNLPSNVVLELFEQRLLGIQEKISEFIDYANGARARGIEQFFWIHVSYQLAMWQTELEWITQLRAEIRSGAVPWPALTGYSTTPSSSQQNRL